MNVQPGVVVNGWRVLCPTTEQKTKRGDSNFHNLRVWLLECEECGARIRRVARTIMRSSTKPQHMGACSHPLVDESRRFSDDHVCRELLRIRGGGFNLREIGWLMGISHERARQIEEAALSKLRKLPPEALENLRDLWRAIEDKPGERTEPETGDNVDCAEFTRAFYRMCRKHGYPVDDKRIRRRWAQGQIG